MLRRRRQSHNARTYRAPDAAPGPGLGLFELCQEFANPVRHSHVGHRRMSQPVRTTCDVSRSAGIRRVGPGLWRRVVVAQARRGGCATGRPWHWKGATVPQPQEPRRAMITTRTYVRIPSPFPGRLRPSQHLDGEGWRTPREGFAFHSRPTEDAAACSPWSAPSGGLPSGAVSAGSNPAGGTGQRHKLEHSDNLGRVAVLSL